jgi:hypothetical protein
LINCFMLLFPPSAAFKTPRELLNPLRSNADL